MNYFDCHADTLTAIRDADETLLSNHREVDLARVGAFADRYTQIFAIFADMATVEPKTCDERFWETYTRARDLLAAEESRISLVTSAAQMHEAHAAGRAAAFLSIEDVSFMGSYAFRAFELGFRFAMLTWEYDNRYACGASENQAHGLTPAGRELARTFLDQGIVMDVSHTSDAGVEDLFNLTDAPLMASHSDIRDLRGVPRNLARWQVDELIRRRGLIGLNFYGEFLSSRQATVDDVLRHADYILSAGGEDVLALGGDLDGCYGVLPTPMEGVQSIPALRRAFAEHLGEDIAEKVFFTNAVAFVDRVL